MPRLRWPAFVVALGVLGSLTCAGPARAHAILVDSTPAAGATLPAGHADIRLRFNSRIDATRSRVSLSAGVTDKILTHGKSDQPNVMLCPADLLPGAYVLHWQVLGVDGHITRGTVAFTVTAAEGGG